MSSRSADKIKIKSYDELFNGGSLKEEEKDRIVRLPLANLYPSPNNPYRVVDDELMEETVKSIKEHGVLVPGIVRKRGRGYELVAGHRRKRASELAGCSDMPVIIMDLTDDEAVVIMVDSNIQRENTLPSEKARAYRMRMEALSHQGVKGENSAEQIGKSANRTGRTIQRYIRLTYLKEELLALVDLKKIKIVTGESLSFLSENEQSWVIGRIQSNGCMPSSEQAELLKKYSNEKRLTEELVNDTLSQPVKDISFRFSNQTMRKFFPSDYSKRDMQEVILKLLEDWQEAQEKKEARPPL